MEEENKPEEIQDVQNEIKEEVQEEPVAEEMKEEQKDDKQPKEKIAEGLKKFDFKKWGPIIGGAIAIIIILAVVISTFFGGPEKAVKNYISAINSKNAKKLVKCIDLIGQEAWKKLYIYDVSDFTEDDYDEFIKNYKEIEKDTDKDELNKKTDKAIDSMDDTFDDINDEYKTFSMTINKVKSVDKIGNDLYAVKTRINIKVVPKDDDDDETDETKTITFVVYKNKLIGSDAGNLF